MNEFRRTIVVDHATPYWFVEMGEIPDAWYHAQGCDTPPAWHKSLYGFSSYPFPSEAAAQRFAANHRDLYPGRTITIRYQEGTHD